MGLKGKVGGVREGWRVWWVPAKGVVGGYPPRFGGGITRWRAQLCKVLKVLKGWRGMRARWGGGVREGWREEWGHLVGGYPPDWRVRISEGRSVGAFGVGAGTGQSLAGIRRIKGWRGRGVGTSWQLGVVSEGVVRLFGVREGGGRGRFGALPYFDTKKRRGRGLRGGGAGGEGWGWY